MRQINVRDISLGDSIVENWDKVLYEGAKPKLTKVTQIEHYACNKRDTHVNHDSCYAYCAKVWVA